MCCRFVDTIKDLEMMLGKEYYLVERNRKILNALLKEWTTKTMIIEEAINLNSVSIDYLINSLISYELNLKSKVQDEEEVRAKRSTQNLSRRK